MTKLDTHTHMIRHTHTDTQVTYHDVHTVYIKPIRPICVSIQYCKLCNIVCIHSKKQGKHASVHTYKCLSAVPTHARPLLHTRTLPHAFCVTLTVSKDAPVSWGVATKDEQLDVGRREAVHEFGRRTWASGNVREVQPRVGRGVQHEEVVQSITCTSGDSGQ